MTLTEAGGKTTLNLRGSPLDASDPSGLCSLFSWGGDGCAAAAAAAVPGGDKLDGALTSFVSFGDQVTFGASRTVRHHIGLAGAIDECSNAYNSQAITAVSMVFMAMDGEGEAAAARGALKFSEDQTTLIQMARRLSRKGVSEEDASVLNEWADEFGLKNHGPMTHDGAGYWDQRPHIKIFNVHIPML